MKYKVTVYCGKAGPVRDIEVLANNPSDAICTALYKLQTDRKGGRRGLTEVRVNANTEA
jgi:hypothetical protein